MKPHPRIRKTIKWGGAAVTVLLVVVWIGSAGRLYDWITDGGWCCDSWEGETGLGIGISNGGVFIARWTAIGHSVAVTRGQRNYLLHGFPNFARGWVPQTGANRHAQWASAPLWMPPVVSLCATALAWRLDTLARRRAKLNLCPKCGYDRTGILKDAKCPECGAVPAGV